MKCVSSVSTGDLADDGSHVNIAVVSCGERLLMDVVTLVKTAVMFTARHVDFYIVTEKEQNQKFIEQVSTLAVYDFQIHGLKVSTGLLYLLKFNKWPEYVRNKFSYTFFEPQFPTEGEIDWKSVFKRCATQRLFFPVSD